MVGDWVGETVRGADVDGLTGASVATGAAVDGDRVLGLKVGVLVVGLEVGVLVVGLKEGVLVVGLKVGVQVVGLKVDGSTGAGVGGLPDRVILDPPPYLPEQLMINFEVIS